MNSPHSPNMYDTYRMAELYVLLCQRLTVPLSGIAQRDSRVHSRTLSTFIVLNSTEQGLID